MLRHEWAALTDRDVESISDTEWLAVSVVYHYHPAVADTDGKQTMQALWRMGGMAIVLDLVPAAQNAQTAYEAVETARLALARAEDVYRALKARYVPCAG